VIGDASCQVALVWRGRFDVYRAIRSDGRSVIIKQSRLEHADAWGRERLQHEHAILSGIAERGIPRPLELTEFQGRPALVLEDMGFATLARALARRALETDSFLRFAIPIAELVARVHEHRVMHRDLCPEHFLLDEKDGEVALVGFGLATATPAFAAAATAPADLEGALAYKAPEQTGRMARAVDLRADLYALGALYYEMLTGRAPFPLRDPAELIHAHLARAPQPPAIVNPRVPVGVSDIVIKLLAKMPEWRYQSAQALAADLREALRQWHLGRDVPPFELGRMDLPHGLVVAPHRLYGREQEVRTLDTALEAASKGPATLVLVSGPAGIGKSALIESVRGAARGGYEWISGKADQLRSSAPYAVLSEAMRGLAEQLEQQPAELARERRKRLNHAVAPNGRCLTDAMPELRAIIGPQPALPEVSSVEAANRLQITFDAFLNAWLKGGRPLALVVDDMQWIDAASLKLLCGAVANPDLRSLVVVFAFRGDELDQSIAAPAVQGRARAAGARIVKVELNPLATDALVAFLCDVLRTDPLAARPLAEELERKTRGNPLFVRQFLGYLYRKNLLVCDPHSACWTWRMSEIAEEEVAPNVAELLAQVLDQLPPSSRRVVQAAACIGNRFELTLLSGVLGDSNDAVGRALWEPLEQGMLVPVRDGPRFPWLAGQVELGTGSPSTFRFAHDRIQQAAYEPLAASQRQALHLAIGRWLEQKVPANDRARAATAIVEQLNRAAELLSAGQRIDLARLNEQAGWQARAAAAFRSALDYFLTGLDLLPGGAHEGDLHATWFSLQLGAAECAGLSGLPERSEQLVDQGLALAARPLEQAQLYGISVQMSTIAGAHARALVRGREGLALLGIALPDEQQAPAAAQAAQASAALRLQAKADRALVGARLMVDPLDRARLGLLMLLTSTWFTAIDLFRYCAARGAELCAEKGIAPGASTAFATFGITLVMSEQYQAGYRCGRLALEVAQRLASPVEEARALMCFGAHISPWSRPLLECVSLQERASQRGISGGDLEYAAYALFNLVSLRMMIGDPLDEVLADGESTLGFYRRIGVQGGLGYVQPYVQAIKRLGTVTQGGPGFDDEQFSEARFTTEQASNGLALATFHQLRLQVAYLLSEHATALEEADKALQWLPYLRTLAPRVEVHFYAALTLCAAGRREGVPGHLAQLEAWARHAAMNYRHKRDLVAAELARVDGRFEEALELYQAAIEGAAASGLAQDEALAHELWGRFQCQRKRTRLAAASLEAAVEGYRAWGAFAKAQLLEGEFLHVLSSGRKALSTSVPALDYRSLLDAAESLCGELTLERLLPTMTRVCAEAADAERTVLMLVEDGTLVVRAVADAARRVSLDNRSVAEAGSAPVALIEHAFQSGEVLVLRDALREGPFTTDPYVVRHNVRSVLEIPIVRGGVALGVLYFENNLATDAFSPERAEMLRLLSAQMAIALEGSRLVEQRRRSEAMLRLLSEATAHLTETLDYDEVIAKVPAVAVPAIADWCMVDVIENGAFKLVAYAHADATRADEVASLHRRYPIDVHSSQPQGQVLRSGRSLLVSRVTTAMLRTLCRDDDHRRLVEALSPRSLMICPLASRGRIMGVATFVSSQSARGFDAVDLSLAEELMRRISVALENARLYREAKQAAAQCDASARAGQRLLSLLRATIEATADGILVVDRAQRVSAFNERFLTLWHIDRKLAEGGEDERLISFVLDQLQDPEGFLKEVRDRYARPEVVSMDVLHFRDGRVFERYSGPQRIGDEIVGRVWSFRDVTDRDRLLRRALFLSDATRLLGSLESEEALDGVAHLAVQELAERCVIDLFGEGEQKRVWAGPHDAEDKSPLAVHPAVRGGQSVIYLSDGHSCLGVPLLIKGNLVGALTLCAREPRRYTAADLDLAEELARRTALSIENGRLFRRARDALAAREEFLSIAAHEIRGPIHSIHLAVQTIRQREAPAEALPRLLEVVERQDRRLSQFVDELLDLGRMQAGRLEFDYEDIDLSDVVRDATSRLGSELARSGSTLTVMASRAVIGHWDRSRMDQVVTNLVSNAMKFGRGRPIEVSVGAEAGSAWLRVQDHGIGMDDETRGRIFRPFQRGVSVRHYGGLGLGLHIVKTIVDAQGGSVDVESRPGAGTTFTVKLPQRRIEEHDHAHLVG
jgi:predicted ATPase/signal transduction histidine kinase/tRNA A-37 threonylcarbamoyl transferase component Bud32